MTIVTKDFDASNSLDRGIMKPKPAVFSNEDLNYHTGILKYAIDNMNLRLGALKKGSANLVTLNAATYVGGTLTYNVDIAEKSVVINGTELLIPAQNITGSIALGTGLPIADRKFGIYLAAQYVQYISSQKQSANAHEFFSGIGKVTSDAIASITNNTLQGGNPVIQVLEGFDFVGYDNIECVVLSDSDYQASIGGQSNLVKLATIVLESDGNVRFMNGVDSLPDLFNDILDGETIGLPTYLNRLRQYCDESLSDLSDSVDVALGNLSAVYASLNLTNTFNKRVSYKVHAIDAVNITNSPLPILGGGSITTVAGLTESSLQQSTSVLAFYDTATDSAAIYVNDANFGEISFNANKGFVINKIFCSPLYAVGSSGARNEVTLHIKYPNGPIVEDIQNSSYSPAILLSQSIKYLGSQVPSNSTIPLFVGNSRESVIKGYFTGNTEFIITYVSSYISPESYFSLKREIGTKINLAPIVINMSDCSPNSSLFTGIDGDDEMALIGKLFSGTFSFELSTNSIVGTLMFTLPVGFRPKVICYFFGIDVPSADTYLIRVTTNGVVTMLPPIASASITKIFVNLQFLTA